MKNFDLPAIAFTIIVFIIVVLVSLKLFPQWQASVPQFVVLIATAAVAAVGITAGSKAIIQKASRNLPAPANLKVKIQSQQFTKAPGSRPWTQEDPPKSEYGFDLQGVPNWASLWAQLIIANFGLESGSLHLELDKERSKVPSLFDLSKARTEFNPVLNLQGRTSQHRDLY